jgi:Uma2 family endonuclease
MAAAVAFFNVAPVHEEQRMLLNATWKEYILLRDVMDSPSLRMTFLKGSLELMSPSPAHEMWKKNIARLVELYAHRRGIDLYGYGSATFKKEMAERGAEPDECYLIGEELRDYPHIILEVIHSSPLLNKLDVYASMGIREVWVFRDGVFWIYALATDGAYREQKASELIATLDFAMVARYAVRTDTPRALREFEQEISDSP